MRGIAQDVFDIPAARAEQSLLIYISLTEDLEPLVGSTTLLQVTIGSWKSMSIPRAVVKITWMVIRTGLEPSSTLFFQSHHSHPHIYKPPQALWTPSHHPHQNLSRSRLE